MKKMHLFSFFTVAISTFLTISSFAALPMTMDGFNPTFITPQPIIFNGNSESAYSGATTGTLNGGATEFFFCVDLRHNISVPGNYSVNIVNPNTAGLPAYLGLSSPFNLGVATSLLNNANIPSFGNDTSKYAGLQLAVWSIAYDWTASYHPTNTLGTAADLFSAPGVTGQTLADALNFLSIAEGFVLNNTYNSSFGAWRLLINSSDRPGHVNQTLVGVTTPEPGTYLVLCSFLLVGAFAFRRQRMQRIA